MPIKIEEDKLKEGLLGLVVALVEIIAEVLKLQAIRRMEEGLSPESIERLGQNIYDIFEVIEQIKRDQGLAESVNAIRENLDTVIDDFVNTIVNPEEWVNHAE
ncbi:MAG TPA: gas vesicle protein K [Firmicutes bacterium]|nr:gas vesicle protein K [Bacillota bacterium]